jgi:hypothetical protein
LTSAWKVSAVFELGRADHRHRNRHVLQPRLAVLGGDDDLLDLRRVLRERGRPAQRGERDASEPQPAQLRMPPESFVLKCK